MNHVNLLTKAKIAITKENAVGLSTVFNRIFTPGGIIEDPSLDLTTPTIDDFELLSHPVRRKHMVAFIQNKTLTLESAACEQARQNLHDTQDLCSAWLELITELEDTSK